MALISIVVPCYNHGCFLEDALQSLRAQTLEDWQCFVVDDGSTDDSAAVATRFQKLDGRIELVSQRNQGLPFARNAGLRRCQGQYVLFLDADDAIHREALSWLAAGMEKAANPVCLMGVCDFRKDPLRDAYAPRLPPEGAQMLPDLLRANFGPPHCYLASRQHVVDAGGFDESTETAGCEDWDIWLRLALRGAELFRVPRVGAYYRRQPVSMSTDVVKMLSASLVVQHRGYKALLNGECSVSGQDLHKFQRIARRALRTNLIALSGALLRLERHELAADFIQLAAAVGADRRWAALGIARLNAIYRRWRYAVPETTPQVLERTTKLRDNLCAAFSAGGPR